MAGFGVRRQPACRRNRVPRSLSSLELTLNLRLSPGVLGHRQEERDDTPYQEHGQPEPWRIGRFLWWNGRHHAILRCTGVPFKKTAIFRRLSNATRRSTAAWSHQTVLRLVKNRSNIGDRKLPATEERRRLELLFDSQQLVILRDSIRARCGSRLDLSS